MHGIFNSSQELKSHPPGVVQQVTRFNWKGRSNAELLGHFDYAASDSARNANAEGKTQIML